MSSPVRTVALLGLVMVTLGVIWHAAEGDYSRPSPPAARNTAAGGQHRPSPVPAAETALAAAWAAPTTGSGVSAGDCTPGSVVTSYPRPDEADVDILCVTEVSVGSGEHPVASVWRVWLAWRCGQWAVEGLRP